FAELPGLWFTPSTKGVMRGIAGVAESDDAPVEAQQLEDNYQRFGFRSRAAVRDCRAALEAGFALIENALAAQGELLVDTKFEFGYAPDAAGREQLIFMDEVGTPDSSRIWRRGDWEQGTPREYSKEQFREALLEWLPDRELALDPQRYAERAAFARSHRVPDQFFLELAHTYRSTATRIIGADLQLPERPRESLLDLLNGEFSLLL
ncbi:MAG: phosphoribosylaminoimidazole-succinocarboxamide synthase, partial [Halieaceae bacterium]